MGQIAFAILFCFGLPSGGSLAALLPPFGVSGYKFPTHKTKSPETAKKRLLGHKTK